MNAFDSFATMAPEKCVHWLNLFELTKKWLSFNLYNRDYIPKESLSATCPICRQQSILPRDGGVSGLQNNIFIINFNDVIDNQNICSYCDKVDIFTCNTVE